jgi:hypothetical protein
MMRLFSIRGGEQLYPPPPDQHQYHYQYHQGHRKNLHLQENQEGESAQKDDRTLHMHHQHESCQYQGSFIQRDSMYSTQDEPPQHDTMFAEQNPFHRQQYGPPLLPPGDYGDAAFDHPDMPPLPTGYGLAMDPRLGPSASHDDTSLFQDRTQDHQDKTDGYSDIGMGLRSLNKEFILKILPLELSSRYGHFHSPPLSRADFVAPPMVLLLGQYRYIHSYKKDLISCTLTNLNFDLLSICISCSVGKTSFIKYLACRDFPGIRVGPEPTTDRFTPRLWGKSNKIIPGAALCSQSDQPFPGLSPYGNNFLSRLERGGT